MKQINPSVYMTPEKKLKYVQYQAHLFRRIEKYDDETTITINSSH